MEVKMSEDFESLLRRALIDSEDKMVLYLLNRHIERKLNKSTLEPQYIIPLDAIYKKLIEDETIDSGIPTKKRRLRLDSFLRSSKRKNYGEITEDYRFNLLSIIKRDQLQEKMLVVNRFSDEVSFSVQVDIGKNTVTGCINYREEIVRYLNELDTVEKWVILFKDIIKAIEA